MIGFQASGPREGTRRHEQNHRYRSRHDQLRGGGDGRRRTRRHHQSRRQPTDAFRGGVHEDGRAACRTGREAPGGHQPREHGLLDQTLHGPAIRRGHRRNEDGAVPCRCGRAQRRRPHQDRRPGLRAAADLGDGAPEAEAGRRGVSRPAGDESGHHRSRVLQRRAAAGDQGGGPDRRPRGDADRQRADGRGVWRTGSTRRRTRRSPSTTSAAARSTSRSSRLAKGSSR